MVEGESGILAVSSPEFMPVYAPSNRELLWPNGTIATTYSGNAPDQLRGPSHHYVWADEPAKWQYLGDAWDNMIFGLRLGMHPQVVATTTPRPIKILRDLLQDDTTHVTRGTTYDNLENLAPPFARKIIAKYEGTRIGRQELMAEMLDDKPGALWSRDMIEKNRVRGVSNLVRIVVAIDPAATSGETSNDTGIVVCGKGADGHGYVLEDASLHESPAGWGKAAVEAYKRWHADRIIGETNNGGEMIEHVIRSIDPNVPYKGVHASRGKITRAEPISALTEQGKIHHVGMFAELEDQMCDYDAAFDTAKAGYSPDRMDAMVWAMTELKIGDADGWDWS